MSEKEKKKEYKEIQRTERCHGITERRGAMTRCKHVTLQGRLCHQHLKKLLGLRITKSGLAGKGKGLWSTRPIAKGSVICKYTGDKTIEYDRDYANPHALMIKKRPPTYLVSEKTNEEPGRYARDARKAKDHNAELQYDEKTSTGYLEATRDIAANEEILTDHHVAHNIQRKRTHIPDLPDDGYIHTPDDVPQKKRRTVKKKQATRKKSGNANNERYVRALRQRLHLILAALKSPKLQQSLKLTPLKNTFEIPEESVTTTAIKELEKLEKRAMVQLQSYLQSSQLQDHGKKVQMSKEKAAALIEAMVNRRKKK